MRMKSQDSLEALYALIFAVCVLLALFLLVGCEHRDEARAEAGPVVKGETVTFPLGSPAVQRLAVEKVEAPMERSLALPGRLAWDEDHTVRVFPPFAGRVTRILAKVGDTVKPGQPLVEMSSPDYAQAQADARKARADLSLAQKAVGRQRELGRAGIVSAKDLEQAETDFTRAKAEADRAMGRLSAYGHGTDSGPDFVLKSPMGGTIVERNLNPGQELRPDQPGNPLFVITDPTRLWASLDANEADLRYLKPGMALAISSTQLPDSVFTGVLRQVADFVDPVSRTVKLRGDVPNAQRVLKAEMFVTARVSIPAAQEPTVDSRAVYLIGAQRYAFVHSGGTTYTRRPVQVGTEVGGRMPVREGLRQGEEVVVGGNLYLDQILGAGRSARPANAPGAAHPENAHTALQP